MDQQPKSNQFNKTLDSMSLHPTQLLSIHTKIPSLIET